MYTHADPTDFEVRYRFLSEAEGGRKTGTPLQGYRCDWIYADFAEAEPDQAYMIWPFFTDSDGHVLPERSPVPAEGIARMVILNQAARATIHKNRIKPGVRGYFVEGPIRVAEATVTKVVDLQDA